MIEIRLYYPPAAQTETDSQKAGGLRLASPTDHLLKPGGIRFDLNEVKHPKNLKPFLRNALICMVDVI